MLLLYNDSGMKKLKCYLSRQSIWCGQTSQNYIDNVCFSSRNVNWSVCWLCRIFTRICTRNKVTNWVVSMWD